jgi:hypothetical protein
MTITDGQPAYDRERAAAAVLAGRARWVEQFVDATGVTGSARVDAIKMLVELPTPSYATSMYNTSVSITKNDDGSYVILQKTGVRRTGAVQLTLTPTDPRAITLVSASTYFEKVNAEMKSSGLSPEEFLRMKQ